MNITSELFYIGVNDHEIDLFEGQYRVPQGISYNSYVLIDEKIAVLDTVDIHFTDKWLKQLEDCLKGRKPDYLIVLHMEPDHSANILKFLEAYPETTLVGNTKTFQMMDQFFKFDFEVKRKVVANHEKMSLGSHQLEFIFAPMVHWPEVMMCYDEKDQVLFSADAFGKFGANDVEEDWVEEARRYYFGIVGRYGAQVQNLLKQLIAYPIQMICALHGPILKDSLMKYIQYYQTWSSYEPEQKGIVMAYNSVYGNTKQAVLYLYEQLCQQNIQVRLYDLVISDMSQVVADAFCFDRLVLATPTYNADIFPFMKEFIHHLTERNYQKRKVTLIENGSWAPIANKVMKDMLSKSKEITYTSEISIHSALKKDDYLRLDAVVHELCE